MRLDHINLRTADLDRMIEFYTRILGLKVGSRPQFDFPGAWLYCGEQAIVHLVAVERLNPAPGELKIEHFALRGSDMTAFVECLDRADIDYRIARVPGTQLTQVHLHDPDGNHLHVDFCPI